MNAQFFDLFPLSVFQDKIILSQDEKNEIIEYIFKIEKETKNINKISGDAWVGDRKGYEYILKKPEMHNLAKLIGEKIRTYVEMLNLNTNKVQIFVQQFRQLPHELFHIGMCQTIGLSFSHSSLGNSLLLLKVFLN